MIFDLLAPCHEVFCKHWNAAEGFHSGQSPCSPFGMTLIHKEVSGGKEEAKTERGRVAKEKAGLGLAQL